jgi:hypothetical protein
VPTKQKANFMNFSTMRKKSWEKKAVRSLDEYFKGKRSANPGESGQAMSQGTSGQPHLGNRIFFQVR